MQPDDTVLNNATHAPSAHREEVWVRGLPLCLDNLVVNRTNGLEATLSEIFSSIDEIRTDLRDFKDDFSDRINGLVDSHESLGLAVGEILESCEVSTAISGAAEPITDVKEGSKQSKTEAVDAGRRSCKTDEMLHGKSAVKACVQQRKDEVRKMYEDLARTQALVQSAVEHSKEATGVIPRVDEFEALGRQTRDDLQRLLQAHSAFSSFFGSEGAFTAGTLREELVLHRQSVEGLAVQITELDAAVKLQSRDLDLSRKIEEVQRLEAAFTATVQEQKAWTARRIQELTLRVDEQPAVVQQCAQSELERSNGNRIEVKLRGELRALEMKVDRFEQVLTDIAAVPSKSCPSRSSSPPKEQMSTTSGHEHVDTVEPSYASVQELKTSNLDEYAYCIGNAKSRILETDDNGSSPPLQRIPSMDVRVRVKSRMGSHRACDGLPRWFQEHRSAVLSSRGADMQAAGARGRRRPQSARPFSH